MPLTKYLVQAIKNALGPHRRVAPYLSDLLSLGKEAVYRRLRSEVTFSFDEVVLIAYDLNISLDTLIGKTNTEKAIFDLNLIDYKNIMENYLEIIENWIKIFRMMRSSPNSILQSAFNVLPYSFCLNYELMSKFQLYKWLYQVQPIENTLPMLQFDMIDNSKDIHQHFILENHSVTKAIFILDRNVFISFAKDVSYFSKLKLINYQEKLELKNELLDLINLMEAISSVGRYNTGAEVLFYLSNIKFEASYTICESDDFEMAHLHVFSMNIIASQNAYVFEKQKYWIESLKSHSTLITGSESHHRTIYFAEQRELVNTILD